MERASRQFASERSYYAHLVAVAAPVDFVPNSYGDRFIPRRYALGRRSVCFQANGEHKPEYDPLETDEFPRNLCSPLYTNTLKEAMALPSASSTMLSFRDATVRDKCRRLCITRSLEWVTQPTYRNPEQLDWSCKPRQKPTGFIEAIHDLPFIKTVCHKIIDWSVRDHIAAIFNKKLVIWSPHTDETMGLRAQTTTAIAFSPSGDRLALAEYMMQLPALHILDMQTKPLVGNGLYKIVAPYDQSITYLIWDGTGDYLLCGLDDGLILSVYLVNTVANQDAEIPSFTYHTAPIRSMKFSCGYKYLATADDSGCIYIWLWKAGHLTPLTDCRSIESEPPIVFFDWHPWREDELAIAESDPIAIKMYHIPTGKMVSSYRSRRFGQIVTAIAFNKISAELVVCLGYIDCPKPPVILVLASMDRVVDVLHNHDDMIFYLLWSPDGMQLASAGIDETLCIWNFFGIPSSKKCKRTKRQYESTIGPGHAGRATDAAGIKPIDLGPTRSKRNKEATYRALASSFPSKAMR
ncbi:retina aberrant in pattern [Anopheles darlingi]|uniref:Retina aberrant in pattern n=1 Tax=Anopheles darlingi TaxID=43151 RepID=W5JVQ7_ANODA|nr:retina aberrant in pattern [Anopheles darlingi]